MRKIFLLLILIALASAAASAKTYNISFAPYCDLMELTASGTPMIYVGGIHDLSVCLGTSAKNEYIGGFRHGFYTSIDPGGMSTILDLTDPTYGYINGMPYPLEYLIDLDTTCAWSQYYDFAGTGHVLGNAGTCTLFKTGAAPKVAGDARPSFMPAHK